MFQSMRLVAKRAIFIRIGIVGFFGACAFSAPSPIYAQPQERKSQKKVDPRAISSLREMQKRYAQLGAFELETSFLSFSEFLDENGNVLPKDSSATPPRTEPSAATGESTPNSDPKTKKDETAKSVDPNRGDENDTHTMPRKVRLRYLPPNRLKFELIEIGVGEKETAESWISDGKFFWTFNPTKNIYTKCSAPRNMRDFAKSGKISGGSLELAMIMGLDPVAEMEKEADEIAFSKVEKIESREMEVVLLRTHTDKHDVETTFFIGADSRLLERMKISTLPRARVAPTEKPTAFEPNPLDQLREPLSTQNGGIQEASDDDEKVQTKVTVVYENSIKRDPVFDVLTFAFEPPAKALYQAGLKEKTKRKTVVQQALEIAKEKRKGVVKSRKTIKL